MQGGEQCAVRPIAARNTAVFCLEAEPCSKPMTGREKERLTPFLLLHCLALFVIESASFHKLDRCSVSVGFADAGADLECSCWFSVNFQCFSQ